jgi:hypothetical protein
VPGIVQHVVLVGVVARFFPTRMDSMAQSSHKHRLLTLLAVGWVIAVLLQSTNTGWNWDWNIILAASGLFLWLACPPQRQKWSVLGVRPVMVTTLLMAIVVMHSRVGLRLRLSLCEQELTEFAQRVERGEEKVRAIGSPRTVGLFTVQSTDAYEGEVILITARSFSWSSGLVYKPDWVPELDGRKYRHLSGRWYTYETDF